MDSDCAALSVLPYLYTVLTSITGFQDTEILCTPYVIYRPTHVPAVIRSSGSRVSCGSGVGQQMSSVSRSWDRKPWCWIPGREIARTESGAPARHLTAQSTHGPGSTRRGVLQNSQGSQKQTEAMELYPELTLGGLNQPWQLPALTSLSPLRATSSRDGRVRRVFPASSLSSVFVAHQPGFPAYSFLLTFSFSVPFLPFLPDFPSFSVCSFDPPWTSCPGYHLPGW